MSWAPQVLSSASGAKLNPPTQTLTPFIFFIGHHLEAVPAPKNALPQPCNPFVAAKLMDSVSRIAHAPFPVGHPEVMPGAEHPPSALRKGSSGGVPAHSSIWEWRYKADVHLGSHSSQL